MRQCINPAAPFAETDRVVADMVESVFGVLSCEGLAIVVTGYMVIMFCIPVAAFAFAALKLR